MKKLIVNADDFGRQPLINQAVAAAADKKCLLSASLMAGEPYFPEAVELAKERPCLGVGVHLTLVDGTPVLPPSELPTLAARGGRFLPDHGAFVKAYARGKIALKEIARELAAQLDKVLGAGIRPTHVDSHQHMHMLPGVFPLVLKLAAERGIRRVRISRGIYGNPFRPWPGTGDLVGKFGLEALSCLDRRQAKAQGFACPDNFVGQVAGGAVTADFMQELAERFPSGSVEVMLHPGLKNEPLIAATGWQHDYEAEFQAVCAPRVQESLSAGGIELINFGDL